MAFIQNQIGLEKSYGYIYMNTGNFTGANFVFTTTLKEITGLSTSFTLASPSQDFAMTTDGRLKYTGLTTKLFSVSAALYVNSGNKTELQVNKNGSAVTGSVARSNNSRIFLDNFPVSMSTNDYLSVFARSLPGATSAITNVSLSAKFIGGS